MVRDSWDGVSITLGDLSNLACCLAFKDEGSSLPGLRPGVIAEVSLVNLQHSVAWKRRRPQLIPTTKS